MVWTSSPAVLLARSQDSKTLQGEQTGMAMIKLLTFEVFFRTRILPSVFQRYRVSRVISAFHFLNLGQNFSFFRSKWVKNMRKGFNQDIQQQQSNKKKTFYYNYYPPDVYAQTVAKHTTYADLV